MYKISIFTVFVSYNSLFFTFESLIFCALYCIMNIFSGNLHRRNRFRIMRIFLKFMRYSKASDSKNRFIVCMLHNV